MAIRTYGPNAVDWEQRIDLDRLRTERLPRLSTAPGRLRPRRAAHLRLRQHPLHDRDPHRHLGDGQADPLRAAAARRRAGHLGLRLGRPAPPAVQPVAGLRPEPGPRDLGRGEGRQIRARAGISTLRGAFHPDAGIAEEVARKVATVLREHGLADEPVGVDLIEMPILSRCAAGEGIDVVDGQQVFLEARRIKTVDEIALLDPGLLDGRRRLRGAVRLPAARACGRTSASAWSARCSTTSAASTSRASTPSPASAARRTRTSTATGSSAPATRRSSTSCTATSATAPATTAASRSAARRRRMRDAYVRCREYMDLAIAAGPAGCDHRRHRVAVADRARSSASPTRRPRSPCSTATASGCRSGRSRSSAGWSRSTTPRRSRRAWSSRSRPTGRRRTAGRPPGSRRRSSSPPTAARSSPSSRPRSCWSPASATGRSAVALPTAARGAVAPQHRGRQGRAVTGLDTMTPPQRRRRRALLGCTSRWR